MIGNYTYLAIEAKENYYYLVPRKGFKFTIGRIQILACDQFFECELLTEQYNLTIRLKEPAIVEKREDKYYLVRNFFCLVENNPYYYCNSSLQLLSSYFITPGQCLQGFK